VQVKPAEIGHIYSIESGNPAWDCTPSVYQVGVMRVMILMMIMMMMMMRRRRRRMMMTTTTTMAMMMIALVSNDKHNGFKHLTY
jgi:hypothetical protein